MEGRNKTASLHIIATIQPLKYVMSTYNILGYEDCLINTCKIHLIKK